MDGAALGLRPLPVYTGKGDAIVPIGVAALGLLLYTILHPRARESRGAAKTGSVEVFGDPGSDAHEPAGEADPADVPNLAEVNLPGRALA